MANDGTRKAGRISGHGRLAHKQHQKLLTQNNNLMRNKLRRLATSVLTCLASVAMLAQQLSVSGNIKDNTGYPVPGAAVMVAGTTQGTVTDFDGNYTLQGVPANGKLTVSFVGFATQTEEVKGRSVIDFTLQDEAKELQEVVAVGYGTVNKRDLTGSVASVKAKDIAAIPVSSASEALTGKMAGVNVSTTEGSPDADVKIRVRGGGSLSQDNSPLYIVDGFPVSSISDIAPSEIESIDVLKDASSTAIYGARGANGVIIVTTKSGKEGKTQVNLNASWGAKKVTKLVKVLNPYEYAMYQYEIESASSSETSFSYGDYEDLSIWKSLEGTDFQDEIFGRWGNQLQYNANVSGGTKDFKYNISFAHSQEKSIMEGSGFNKDNVNVKINTNLNKWLTLDFQARLANQKIKGLSGGADTNESNAANSIVAKSVTFRPVAPLTDSSDDDEENSSNTIYSPLDRLNETYKMQNRFRQDYNVGLNWKPFSGWTFRTEFGYNWRKNKSDQVWAVKATQNSKFGYAGQPQAYFETVEYKNWRNANTITYDNKKLFGKRDRLNVMIGQEWSSTSQTTRNSTSVSFPATFTIDEVLANTSAGTALPNGSDIEADDNMLSFFGRVNYTLMDKYLLTATVRADGSSKFADGNRWGVFPSAAVAWRLLDEDFMEGARDVVQNLKLRVSFGTAGNNRISSGLISTTYSMSGNTDKAPFFDESRSPMLAHGKALYNPDLKWETTLTRNVGIDWGFLDGRLSGNLDFYWNTTKDLLMKATIPSGTGYSEQYQNFGQTSNKGVELALNYAIIDNSDLKLNFTFNIGYNANKIDELNTDNPYQTSNFCGSTINYGSGDFRVAEGGKLGEVWGYKLIGLYSPEDGNGNGNLTMDSKGNWSLSQGNNKSYNMTGILLPGTPMFECDEEGNPVFQKIGETVAPVSGGFGFDAQWRGFDFAAFFNYSLGGDIVNGTKLASEFFQGSRKGYNIVDDMRLSERYTYVDPETGLNIVRPSTATLEAYGGPANIMAKLNEINAGKTQFSPVGTTKMVMHSGVIEDGSFLRINNVTLGYTLKKELTQKWFLEKVRFYVTGYNLYCFTNYSGADPEVDTNKNPMCPGIDYAAYPKSRSVVGGVNITF